jgi:hypothetical protein
LPAAGWLFAPVTRLFIQVFIAYISGQTLDNRETMRNARKDDADRNAYKKQTQTHDVPPGARWLTQPIQPEERQDHSPEPTTGDPMQPPRQIMIADKWAPHSSQLTMIAQTGVC